MELKTVGLIAAMPDEIRPFLKQAGDYKKTTVDGFPIYQFSVAGKQCLLIESGIGIKRAGRATRSLIRSVKPDLIISFGFGGAVKTGMAVGDLVIAGRSLFLQGKSADKGEAIVLPASLEARQSLEVIGKKLGFAVLGGNFLTSDKILSKKQLSETLPPDITNPILDMETWAIAQVAAKDKIPLLAIRAVSDAADEEPDFSLDQFTDSEMNIRISKILRTVVRRPRIIPQLIRLAGNCRIAGRNLAAAIKELLETDTVLPGQ